MNKSFNNAIILFSLFLLFILILFLFLLRANLFSRLDNKLNVVDSSLANSSISKAKIKLNTKILKTEPFIDLTKHAVNFDFDNICFRPQTIQNTLLSNNIQQVSIDGSTSTKTVSEAKILNTNPIIGCRQGNDFPFIVKKK